MWRSGGMWQRAVVTATRTSTSQTFDILGASRRTTDAFVTAPPHLIYVRALSVCLIPCDCCSLGCVTALCCSARALLTSPALRGKASRTSNSTPQPRAPPAELAGDVAGGEREVGSGPPSAADCQSAASGGYSTSVKYLLVGLLDRHGPLCRLCRRFWRRRLAHRHVCSPGTRAGPGTASGRYARAEGRTACRACTVSDD